MLFTAKEHEAKQSMSVVFNVVALFGVMWLVSLNKLISIHQNCSDVLMCNNLGSSVIKLA
jgi:hypothetical protein